MKMSAILKSASQWPVSLCSIVTLVLLIAGSELATAQLQVSLRVDTVSVSPDSATVRIPVWLDNPGDVLAGFTVWFQLDRPDLIKFEATRDSLYDTVYWNCLSGVWPACVDSEVVTDTSQGYDFISEVVYEVAVGSSDSAGSLISGWEFFDARSLGGLGWDVKVTGLSDLQSPPITAGIDPQSGGLLFSLVATILPIPDTLTDRTAIIHVIEAPDQTNFSDQFGSTLTSVLTDGSVTILPPNCCVVAGDADHSGTVTIADVTYGIGRIFSGFAPPVCQDEADANGDNIFDIQDITYLIAFIFSGGPTPICGTTGA